MSIHLDPREVLKYLNQLGYCNITKEQLKEFIYDLKKLVKYDDRPTNFECLSIQPQKQQELGSLVANPTIARHRARRTEILGLDQNQGSEPLEHLIAPCNTTESSYKNINSTSQGPMTIGKENVRGRKLQRSENSYLSSSTNSAEPESVLSSSNHSSVPSSLDIFNTKTKLTQDSHRSGSSKHTKVTTKTTSFIRPWRLVSPPVKSLSDQRRTDPVSLYHHYQAMWKRRKLPGEDSRAELRWSIRERMLGQDPHPRPISQASSVEHLKRTQTKK